MRNVARVLVILAAPLLFAACQGPVISVTGDAEGSSARALAANTSAFKGVNWACPGDNFQSGNLYLSGLSSSDTYASASVVADRVITQLMSLTGSNTVRLPINEPTVSGSYWDVYTGVIDTALTKGKVILCYWAVSTGRPASDTAFWAMWDRVIDRYGSNANAYFEVINEPYGYSTTDLNNLYYSWISRYSVPDERVILDGTGYATGVVAVGNDTRLSGCLLAVHYYSFFSSNKYTSESQWATAFAGCFGSYASRTVCTEWGGPMSTGTKDGVTYGPQDYSVGTGSYFVSYLRAMAATLRRHSMGGVYWPGLRDGDWYSMTTKTGSGSGIVLTLVNASGLAQLQYSWGIGTTSTTYYQIKNLTTGLNIDGAGSTTNGANAKQYSTSASHNQQWNLIPTGSYYYLVNRATGQYLDGMGRTANGAIAGQWGGGGSNNQQWTQENSGTNVRYKNRATGIYLDGAGNTASGADLKQWASSTSNNQKWQLIAQ